MGLRWRWLIQRVVMGLLTSRLLVEAVTEGHSIIQDFQINQNMIKVPAKMTKPLKKGVMRKYSATIMAVTYNCGTDLSSTLSQINALW
jgi:hypothetical protein